MPLRILSKAEMHILEELVTGNTYKEIAVNRNVSVNTVKKHCKNIYRKLKVRNRYAASIIYLNQKTPLLSVPFPYP